jgi:hypothetical protein
MPRAGRTAKKTQGCAQFYYIGEYEHQVIPEKDAGLPDERRKSASDRMSGERRK